MKTSRKETLMTMRGIRSGIRRFTPREKSSRIQPNYFGILIR